jgi:hypothetical protein
MSTIIVRERPDTPDAVALIDELETHCPLERRRAWRAWAG